MTISSLTDPDTGEGNCTIYDSRSDVTEHFQISQDPSGRREQILVAPPRQVSSRAVLQSPSTQLGLAPGNPYMSEAWALLVAIDDYPGLEADLRYVSSSCLNFREALLATGEYDDDHIIVLNNAEATHDSVVAAFRSIGNLAGPEDSFLFFFSGHGGQADVAVSSTEPDGIAESLILYSDSGSQNYLSDYELAQLLERVGTRIKIVMLDSCFSGGFRHNLAGVGGLVGLFSSEEDLPSYTYYQQKIGGVFTGILTASISGASDTNGDGIITAGEMCDHVVSSMTRIPTPDPEMPSRRFQMPDTLRTVPYETPLHRLNH